MTDDLFHADNDATPLDPDEMEGLIPQHITNKEQLNEFEQSAILPARFWALSRGHTDVLTDVFVRRLHSRMFRRVWRWAGEYRRSNKNVGDVDWWEVPVQVNKLVGDASFWVDNGTFPRDELAVRFKHRLVWIHPFVNGNGRHSRLIADVLVTKLGGESFTWGRANLVDEGKARTKYIRALRAADPGSGDFGPLLEFARS